MSDIDTLLYAEDAKRFFEGIPLDQRCFYFPRKLLLPDLQEGSPPKVNLLFHKSQFLVIGGYDEDYAGHYGERKPIFTIA